MTGTGSLNLPTIEHDRNRWCDLSNRWSNRLWGLVLGCVVAVGMCATPGMTQPAPAVRVEAAGRTIDFTESWKFLPANTTGAEAPRPDTGSEQFRQG